MTISQATLRRILSSLFIAVTLVLTGPSVSQGQKAPTGEGEGAGPGSAPQASSGALRHGAERAHLPKPTLAQSDKDFLLVLARKTLGEVIAKSEATSPPLQEAPGEEKGGSHVVVVSLFGKGRMLKTATAQEDSLANSTRKAACKVGEGLRPFKDASDALKSGRILIDIIGEKARIPTSFPRAALRSINLGLEGIEVDVKGVGAYVTPLTILINSAQGQSVVVQLFALAGLSQVAEKPEDVQFSRFSTTSFIESAPGAYPLDLYRGNVLLSRADSEDLETAAFAAGRWLVKMQDAVGKFINWFNPITQIQEPRYDMLHHAGACLALMELYDKTHDEAFLLALKQGRDFLMRQMKQTKRGGRRVAYIEVGQDGSVGVSALALLLMAEWGRVSGEKPEAQIMDDLGAFIVQMQADSGAFYRLLSHAEKRTFPAEEQQTFYAGQAIYALCRAHKILPHDEWVEAAVKGGGYQMAEFAKTTNPDPWVMRGLTELYDITQDDALAKAVLQMGDMIVAHQLKPGAVPDLDYIGGFDDANPPRTVSAARFAQGLCIAHALAKKLGKPTERYRQAMELAGKFILQQQLRPENSFFIVNLAQALDGFHQSPIAFDLRIDYAHHAIMAALASADILREKEK